MASLALALVPDAANAQHPAEQMSFTAAGADTGRGVLRCFGISIDRGCHVMLQYELGYRVAAAGRGPKLDAAKPRERSDRSQLFVAGGVLVAASTHSAVGVVYDAGAGDKNGTRALGVRWARGFAHETRIDLTAGATWLPLVGDSIRPTRSATARGAFVEVALHGSNALTLVARDEAYVGSGAVEGRNLVFAGARAEAIPAAVMTMIGVALAGVALGLTGPNW